MEIPLNQFEQVIDEKILKLGLSYYKQGRVNELDEVSPGCYETIVKGTENYTVRLLVKNGIITDFSCNCPYDWGPVCKHIAATIFNLQEKVLGYVDQQPKAKRQPRGKNAATQIKEMLAKATKEELEQFIIDEASNNAVLRSHILTVFDKYNDTITTTNYLTIINALVKKVVDRHGFVDWRGARIVGNTVAEMLDNAKKHLDNQSYDKVLPVAFAVVEGLREVNECSDDSSGDIGGCISMAIALLEKTAEECSRPEISRLVFDTCIKYYGKEYYKGYGWDNDFLRIAASLVSDDKDFTSVMNLLEKPHASEYELNDIQLIKYNLLKKIKGDAVADEFLETNLSNPILRRLAIEQSITNRNFEKAIKLAKDGIKNDEARYPGLAKDWYEYLLKTAQAQHDTSKIIEYARFLFVDGFKREQDYYQILKDNVDSQQWPSFFEILISDIRKHNRYDCASRIADIYVREEMWNRLFAVVKEKQSLSYTSSYEKYLSADYAEQLAEMYAKMILIYMEDNMGRGCYQEACRYIRRMKKLGASVQAEKVISTLRTLYPKRKALMEELANV